MKLMRLVGRALSPLRPGVDALTGEKLSRRIPTTIEVTSPVFKESDAIPRLFTAQGDGRFPGIAWSGLPDGTRSVVLLVEDERKVRVMAAERLRESTYCVLEAEDGAAALTLLRSGVHIDLLVTDVGLPGGMNGRQVADAVREHRPGLPVLFITGYAGAALERQLAPGMAVIGKPFTLDALAAEIGNMLSKMPTGGAA